MTDVSSSSRPFRLPLTLVAWLLIAGTVVGLLLAHTAERAHAAESLAAGGEVASSVLVADPAPVAAGSVFDAVSAALGLDAVDGGLLCAALAIGCVIALVFASLRNPPRLGGVLSLLPRPGPLSTWARSEAPRAASLVTVSILRL